MVKFFLFYKGLKILNSNDRITNPDERITNPSYRTISQPISRFIKVMKKYFIIWIALLSSTITHGQNCDETLKLLKGVWYEIGSEKDTTFIIIKENRMSFNYKTLTFWEEKDISNFKLVIDNSNVPTNADCKFIMDVSRYDTTYFEILNLTDTSLDLNQYPGWVRFPVESGNSDTALIHEKFPWVNGRYCKKIKGLEPNFTRASVFGEWLDEDTKLILKPDSSFSIIFSTKKYEYSTCGKFNFDGKVFVLKDIQDKDYIKYSIDCDNLKATLINGKSRYLKNKHLLFDKNNEIHLYYNILGLWLKETHMILVK